MRGIQERISRVKCHHTVLMSTGSIFSPISRLIFTALYCLIHCIKLCRPSDVALTLRDIGKSEYLGEILLSATLWPRTQEDKDQVSYVTPTTHRILQSATSIIYAYICSVVRVYDTWCRVMHVENIFLSLCNRHRQVMWGITGLRSCIRGRVQKFPA